MLVGLRSVSLGSDTDGLSKSTLREMKLLSQLRHVNIVHLFEIVKDKNALLTGNYVSPSGRQSFVHLWTLIWLCSICFYSFSLLVPLSHQNLRLLLPQNEPHVGSGAVTIGPTPVQLMVLLSQFCLSACLSVYQMRVL